jgi:CDGSH-type Zn-finger protein/uncharacterized Fe-S cluster protein YjdI
MNRVREYQGKEITILYDPGRCIHGEKCIHGAPRVFDKHGRPWVNADGDSAPAIAAVIRECPTGALHDQARDASLAELPDAVNTVTTQPDGPLVLSGDITVVMGAAEPLRDTCVALCRCGASATKPLCDGSHTQAGFSDPGLAGPRPESRQDETSGELRVEPQANGPLYLQGKVKVLNARGDAIFEGHEAWLCRCGSSADKPFCGGSHARVGFKAD